MNTDALWTYYRTELPEVEVWVLVFDLERGIYKDKMIKIDGKKSWLIGRPTHWMNMPLPPGT